MRMLRRSTDAETTTSRDDARRTGAGTDTRTDPEATEPRRRGWRRDRSASFSTKIERAAERAADATRTAAAVAAAERAHARPRASLLATLSLIVAVLAGVAVATGVLAGLGVAIGIVAVLLGLAGLAATGRKYRFMSGRGQAMLALLIAIAAIVIGSLALAGNLSWLDPDTSQVDRLRDALPSWLT
ncbi:MAG TPA: hypothetical protein VIL37_05645 [Natronosporangium sp.]